MKFMRRLIEQKEKEMPQQQAIPEMLSVDSSNVHSIGYDEPTETLYVRFWKSSKSKLSQVPGSVYKYFKVPKRVFTQMFTARSKGQFVWERLRERYRYAMVGRAGWRQHSPGRPKSTVTARRRKPA
jgi:hypothetical protein